ncbi:MAG: MBL fold metallo-hydrolase [Wenzhouxiangella sp.]
MVVIMLAACAVGSGRLDSPSRSGLFSNLHEIEADTGQRLGPTYFLRRARVQILRNLARTEVPPTVVLDLESLEKRQFAVSWLGHSSILIRVDGLWVLIDPVLTNTAGPVAGFGPARLTPLPIAMRELPRIDLVLISHDHYDHLDLPTVRHLARQAGGPPRFMVGLGLADWFQSRVGVEAEQFDWWEQRQVGDITLHFVPAHHNSGRSLRKPNITLWGGWAVEHAGQRFLYTGDTAYVQALFQDIRAHLGPIDLAAIPVGVYLPREAMRFEHVNPEEAVLAHLDLGAKRSFGVHWGTFQLGDDEPFEPVQDLAGALEQRQADGFGLLPIGALLDVVERDGAKVSALLPPLDLRPGRAERAAVATSPESTD